MIKHVRTLFFLVCPALFLSACGSGVSSSNAGGPGTNTGTTGYILFATTDPTFQSSNLGTTDPDCFSIDPETLEIDEPPSATTDFVDFIVTLQDQTAGLTPLQNRGVTFDSYRLVYHPINQGTPVPLTPKQRALTFPLPIPNGATTATATIGIVIVDLETKLEYAERDSGSPNTYNVNITYYGRDFITNQPVSVVADTQIEIGCFEGDGA
jgi:hypothetical protein